MSNLTDLKLLFTFILLAVLSFAGKRMISFIRWRRDYRLPPRVPGLPLLGNIFQVPFPSGMYLKALAEKHGEMFTLKFGSQTWVFLNSSRVVNDLLVKRSTIYSSRPSLPMAQGLLSGNDRFLLMPYGERWRRIRKVMHQILNTGQADKFKVYEEEESRRLLWAYLKTPDKWYLANQRYSNSIILKVVLGRSSDFNDPQLVKLYHTADYFLHKLNPAESLVDMFTWLDALPKPLQWWRPRALKEYQITKETYEYEIELIKEKAKNGTAKPCFALDYMRATENFDTKNSELVFIFGTLIEAGSDTSRIAIGQVIAAAAIYPEWVQKARAELDAVCGSHAERLPGFEDRDSLPYITAATKEALRWRPFIQTGVFRTLTQDDEYEKSKFPAGTIFTWNAWAIALNPEEYEDPEVFKPERFLNEDLNHPLKGHWSFGAGRRVCAGWNVGDMNVWIALARLIYCFDFSQVPGQQIDTFTTIWEKHDGPAFAIKIQPRSPQHAAIIETQCSPTAEE